jgi:3-methyladenine DNA glycosylase AlkD
MHSPEAYFQIVRQRFREAGNPDTAEGQMRYMRNQFAYFGLKMPQWAALSKAVFAEQGMPEGEALRDLARLCFDDEHRELHYFALEVVQKSLKRQPAEFVDFLEELICTRSWWDTVDWLAKLVGLHFRRHPALILPVTARWMASGNFWLQRVSIIFQLNYKDKTDVPLLFEHIRQVAHSKEFFLQKAAGWALRQYAKTDPERVRHFVQNTTLSPLTRREALKHV